MAINLTQLDTDLAYMTIDLPVTFTWNGNNYSAVKTDINKGSTLEVIGDFDDIQFQIIVRTALFTEESGRPVEDDIVSIDSVSYRIGAVSTATDDVSLTLDCAELTD